MSGNVISGGLTQPVNTLGAPVSTTPNRVEGKFTAARDAYQLAKLLDPTIGALEEWLASLAAAPVEMQVAGGYVQWRLEGELVWMNLFALSDVQTPTDAAADLGGEAPSDGVVPTQAAVKAYVDALTYEDVGAQPAGSYATLDGGGKVPASQLPSYVDDVLEFADVAHFPNPGTVGVIYIAIDVNKTYRWGGSAYFEISASPGSTDAVPEGSINLYFTSGRASAAAPVQSVNGYTGTFSLTYTDVGAAPASHAHDDRYYTETEADILLSGKVPTARTVNGYALSSNVTLTAADVGADVSGAAAAVQQDLDTAKALTYIHLTSGIVSGGVLSINADPTKFNVSAGTGYVVDFWTTPGSPVLTKVTWGAFTAQASSYLTSDISTTVMIKADGTLRMVTSAPSRDDYTRYIVLGKLLHPNLTSITGVSQYQHSISGSVGNAMDLMHFMGTLADGIAFTANGANLLLTRSAGRLLRIGGNYTADKSAPNITPIAAQTTASFFYRYRNGSGGFRIDTPAITAFNPSAFDDGSGTLATLQNSKYANHRIYIFTSGNVYVVPGQTEYNSLNAAVAAIATESFAVDPQLADANLRCVISCRGGTTSLQSADVRFTQGGIMGVLGGAAGGGGTTSPGGSTYDIQFNNDGVFGGAAITGLVKAQGSSGAPIAATPDVDYATPASVAALAGQVTDVSVGSVLNSAAAQTTLADADKFTFIKSVGSVLSSVTWANIKAALNSFYVHLTGGQTIQSATATTTTLTLKAAASHNGSYPLLLLTDSAGTSVASIGHTGLITGSAATTNEFRLGNRPFATQAPNALTFGSDTYWTTINYGNASTTNQIFQYGNVGIGATPQAKLHVQGNTVNQAGVAQVVVVGLTSSNVGPVTDGFGFGIAGQLEAADGVLYGAGQISCLWQNATSKLSAWSWTTRAGAEMRWTDTGLGLGTINPGAKLHVQSTSQSTKGLIVQGAASQLSNLIEAQNSGGTTLFYVSATGATSALSNVTGDGSAASPAYSFASSTGTGAYLSAANVWGVATGGVSRFLVYNGAIESMGAVRGLGTLALPTFCGSNDTNTGLWMSGLDVWQLVNGGAATVTGTTTGTTFTGDITVNGTSSRMPNQLATYADSVITRQLIREEIFRMLMWSRLDWRRLAGTGVTTTGTGATGGSAYGGTTASSGTSVNSRVISTFESGMSAQAGSGGSWAIPTKFAYAGNMWSLLISGTVNATNIVSGSNQFTANINAAYVYSRVWSPYFPSGTYITAISGTTITVSQNATGTMAAASSLTYCLMGVNRFFAATAPIGATLSSRYCYETPQCEFVASTAAGWNAGQTSLVVGPHVSQNCNWSSGATSITMTASNSAVVAGMHVSGGANIPAGTTVVSVSGTTINLSTTTTGTGSSYPVCFFSPTVVGMALSLTDLDPTTTVATVTNNRTDGLFSMTISGPLPLNYASGMEIGFRNLNTSASYNNNGIGFEFRPDPLDGILKLRIVAVRAGVLYFSSYAQFPEGAQSGWQNYIQWILDYDGNTNTARLFASRQATSSSIPTLQTAPIATLVVPGGIHGRTSGLQVGLQSCCSNLLPQTSATVNSIGTHGIDYFPDRTYPY